MGLLRWRLPGRRSHRKVNYDPKKGVRQIMVKSTKSLVRLGLAGALCALAGCAGMKKTQVARAGGPPPLVQDCAIVTIGSPTKYACNDKTYTSFDLAKLRLEWEKSHGG